MICKRRSVRSIAGIRRIAGRRHPSSQGLLCQIRNGTRGSRHYRLDECVGIAIVRPALEASPSRREVPSIASARPSAGSPRWHRPIHLERPDYRVRKKGIVSTILLMIISTRAAASGAPVESFLTSQLFADAGMMKKIRPVPATDAELPPALQMLAYYEVIKAKGPQGNGRSRSRRCHPVRHSRT
jgi:hypothetical protein